MKKLLLFVVCVCGAFAPVLAAPSVEQVQQFVQDQPQNPDPRVVNAQEAFGLASMNYALHKMSEELTDNEKQIDRILEAQDLNASLQASVATVLPPETFANITTEAELTAKMEQLLAQDPQLEQKILQAYYQNKYIKQLIPLFWANQDEYTANTVDKQTFNELVATFTVMTASLMEQMKQAEQ